MPVPRHLDEAVMRLKTASARIDEAREQAASVQGLQQWLAALTDFCLALADIQAFNNESVHEKLHEIAGRAGVRALSPARSEERRPRTPARPRPNLR